MTDELRYRVLKILENNPEISQRALAVALGISLGKVNYCLQALMSRGLVKTRNFKNSRNKRAYMYYLTPQGVEDKAKVTYQFLRAKMAEIEELRSEIEQMRSGLVPENEAATEPVARRNSVMQEGE